ncbi:MAG: hypothetical protein DSO02_03070, partial [Hadesarchaea archaeon]
WRRAGRKGRAFEVYEVLAEKWEKRGDFFKAADSYERAAELVGMGKNYRKPGEAWMKCAEGHMKKGDLSDALWALERAERYFRRVGDFESLRVVEGRRKEVENLGRD